MQNTGASISGIKPQSIIKAPLSGILQLDVMGQMRFTVKRIPLGETLLHRDFQADLLVSRNIEKTKWLRADNNSHFCELVRGAVRLHRRGTDSRP